MPRARPAPCFTQEMAEREHTSALPERTSWSDMYISSEMRRSGLYSGCGKQPKQAAMRLAASDAHFVEARAAIDRAIILGQEWNLSLYAALSADDGMHLAGCAFGAAACVARSVAACIAARFAATGLVHQTFLLVELLFACGENEIITAVAAFEGFVSEVQLGTSLVICWLSSGSISGRCHQSIFSPYQRGMRYLDELCMRDRDWIPKKSIHYPQEFYKGLMGN